MDNLRDRINFITKELQLAEEDFQLVRLTKYRQILISILERFTSLKANQINNWWWNFFLEPTRTYYPENVFETLPLLIDERKTVYFIIEDERKVKESFWLYEGKLPAIIAVLKELSFEEYYIVSKKLDWIICENHHNLLIASGEILAEKVKLLSINSDKIEV